MNDYNVKKLLFICFACLYISHRSKEILCIIGQGRSSGVDIFHLLKIHETLQWTLNKQSTHRKKSVHFHLFVEWLDFFQQSLWVALKFCWRKLQEDIFAVPNFSDFANEYLFSAFSHVQHFPPYFIQRRIKNSEIMKNWERVRWWKKKKIVHFFLLCNRVLLGIRESCLCNRLN